MGGLRFQVLLFYFERPRLALGALESIRAQTYGNYEVAFIDDSEDPEIGNQLLLNFCYINGDRDNPKPYTYIHTNDTLSQKESRGGSIFGYFANEASLKSEADVVIPLCDDDRLTPWYLEELNQFYLNNPAINNSYCDVIIHNPLAEDWKDVLDRRSPDHFLNTNHNPHCGANSKDSSQMSYRMSCVRDGVRWPYPCTAALDFQVWLQLYGKYGDSWFNGITGQIKGWGGHQLGGRGNTYGKTE